MHILTISTLTLLLLASASSTAEAQSKNGNYNLSTRHLALCFCDSLDMSKADIEAVERGDLSQDSIISRSEEVYKPIFLRMFRDRPTYLKCLDRFLPPLKREIEQYYSDSIRPFVLEQQSLVFQELNDEDRRLIERLRDSLSDTRKFEFEYPNYKFRLPNRLTLSDFLSGYKSHMELQNIPSHDKSELLDIIVEHQHKLEEGLDAIRSKRSIWFDAFKRMVDNHQIIFLETIRCPMSMGSVDRHAPIPTSPELSAYARENFYLMVALLVYIRT